MTVNDLFLFLLVVNLKAHLLPIFEGLQGHFILFYFVTVVLYGFWLGPGSVRS